MKLTAEQVTEIRELLMAGVLQKAIAEQFGVSQATVSLIKNGKTRKNK